MMIQWLRNIQYCSSAYSIYSLVKFVSKRLRPGGRTIRGQILSPWLRDIVDSGIGLSYWSASLCRLAGCMVGQPYARVNYIPQPGTKNLATGHQERVYSKEENPGFIPPFFILHLVKGFLCREPECLSNRLNWVPHLLPCKRVWLPLKDQVGGGEPNSHAGRGWGDPIQTTGQTLWYSTNVE